MNSPKQFEERTCLRFGTAARVFKHGITWLKMWLPLLCQHKIRLNKTGVECCRVMLNRMVKVATVMATSVIAIPYALAILANLLYGWPRCENKYARALHPKKVFLLNCALLDQLFKVKYLKLVLRSRYFHSTAPRSRLIKVSMMWRYLSL